MTVTERIDLLRHDITWLEHARGGIESTVNAASPSERHRLVQGASGAAIHDFNCLIGWLRTTVNMFDRAVKKGTSLDALQRGADRMCSDAECRVLAFRRGGHMEYKRIQKAQVDRDKAGGYVR
jgi:hypothetical protein